MISLFSNTLTAEGSTSMISRTADCGKANRCPPTLAMSASATASVRGSSTVKRVPRPFSVASVSAPPSSATAPPTTSIPTPRPLARSASSRVEKPGAQVSRAQAAFARARQNPFGVDAAPVVRDLDQHVVAGGRGAQRESALGRLPRGDALGHRLQPVADGVADEVQQRVHHALDEELVYLGLLPQKFEPDLLAARARQVADDEPHALEDFADLHHPHAHDAFAQVAQLSRYRHVRLLQRAPLGGGHAPPQRPQPVFQARATRDQLA